MRCGLVADRVPSTQFRYYTRTQIESPLFFRGNELTADRESANLPNSYKDPLPPPVLVWFPFSSPSTIFVA